MLLEPATSFPDMPLTLPRLFGWAAQQFGDKAAIGEQTGNISYTELNDARRQAAKAFYAIGVRHGDRVAIWAPNSAEWIVAAAGLQSVGAILVPLNTRLQESEAADILHRAGVTVLVTTAEFRRAAPKLVDKLTSVNHCILLPASSEPSAIKEEISWADFLALAEQTDNAQFIAIERAVNPHDSADMLFTSGTTGKAKGVLCSHEQNIRVFQTWSATVGLRSDDNYLIINPFFHSFGYKAGWLAAIICGATILPMAKFDKQSVMEAIQRDKVTMLPGAPSLYEMLLADDSRHNYDLSSLRLGVTGAASVPVQLVRDMRSELGFETVVTAYGLTESTGVVTICRPDDDAEIIASTSGRAIDGVDVKCADPNTGIEVERGCEGEVWVRGYNVMQAYFDMPEATADAITADGWLKTGDIGVMDAQGYLRITDRLKDMYIMNGENVYPAEVEKVLYGLSGVAQVAVIGVPKVPQGEVGMAFVVRKPDSKLDVDSVRTFCGSQLASYKVPYYVEFVDALPLNASGKVVKTELKTIAADRLNS
ncbi:3-[(3aS,4S,7aS)-7a-methyl-1,5-dioxo-octahydro-1H-inden-4-yl]propanoyl:CoA ligase [Zhongshania aliphaticivorans]|uniref:3-[(3aS,4S,7aS)-7a-methyl-1,5-dioxo-octahydro-1H-inden-4-yl]propanoyl:CoA ligase n=1 Tax=Zhongshania aliphaticivorans TaxID=1470434 RepID=A0A5S9MYS2_9GAMM|nr:FadD3 family acyl-CoA ligase [Zhongshania aliphaticivorans]CAA0082640.1 3-[(3aS,4S,7aS)-7a-methyl-1,5-dioxo-octahydro-1H-inden-4-yl]propanoyl:CoA ligase [Zhongshania aliphaticivorans]CAA0084074.1 3-[(3aS,4S,7aS)-7a-methyl-1,5-dioxo-octahydro-1H-inden-4-yl]propanoyl:CoA ligase [Zhongshania aliphaticivorans]